MVEELIATVGGSGTLVLVALTFALVFAESAVLLDLFVPGEVGLVLAGAAAADAGAPVWAIIVAATAGCLAGDSVGFAVGRRFGEPTVRRWRWSRRLLAPRLARAREHFERRGGWSVAGARWVGALRAVVPVVAGAARRPYGWFVAWDAPSSVAWSTAVALAGYHLGDEIARAVDRIGLVISAVVIGALVVLWLVRRRRAEAAEPAVAARPVSR
jgi:membrane protein DedA with SNARE-associated domain